MNLFLLSLHSEKPSLIEYLSYNLNFLSVLVGPCSNFKDYKDFIEGRHISGRLRQHFAKCNGHNGCDRTLEPSPMVRSHLKPSVYHSRFMTIRDLHIEKTWMESV